MIWRSELKKTFIILSTMAVCLLAFVNSATAEDNTSKPFEYTQAEFHEFLAPGWSWKAKFTKIKINKSFIGTKTVAEEKNYKGIPVYTYGGAGFIRMESKEDLGFVASFKKGQLGKELLPSDKRYDWPLYVGKSWSAIAKDKQGNEVKIDCKVTNQEWVKAPVGEYEAFKVEQKFNGDLVKINWWAPKINMTIKNESYRNGEKINIYEVAKLPWKSK